MPSAPAPLALQLFHHHTDRHYEALVRDKVLERARRLVRRAREKGLRSLRSSTDPLVEIGMEVDEGGRVTKNSLGVLDLSWQAAKHREWPGRILDEVAALRAGVYAAHGVPLENLLWVGMGGSSEDKAMYDALGLLSGGVRVYLLDSTDPGKLQAILEELTRRGDSLPRALRKTLVVAMAMGMTSYEPVLNLEKLALLYEKNQVPSKANFLYMTLPGSLLDRFAGPRGYRRVELQLDDDNTTAGRHSGPLTRGSLYPLVLNGIDPGAWMAAACLDDQQVQEALRMAAFLHGNGVDGRDKVTLLLPASWAGAGIWTKQDFEESLGKGEELGIKIFPWPSSHCSLRRPVRHPEQDRIYWVVNVGEAPADPALVKDLRQLGYPLAVLSLHGSMSLARYMQWVHYVVFGMGCLRRMNFVTQPGVELYKQIAAGLDERARKVGRIEKTREWRQLGRSRFRAAAPGRITMYYDSLVTAGVLASEDLESPRQGAAEILARALRRLRELRKIEYAELTFYGDTRYRAGGRELRLVLDQAADTTFAAGLGISTDVYEGPAMNHSYHEMIIGHGRCFSMVLLARRQVTLRSLDYGPGYHQAQWLATKLALERRGRAVVALTLPDVTADSRAALAAFFRRVGERLTVLR